MILRARKFTFTFPRPALIMGIVNVTPDSFSDGGQFFDKSRAVDRALQLAGEGADILDIGGESTRPHAEPVTELEEIHRAIPVCEALAGKVDRAISIDTQKPNVARTALEAGASIVNDVGGTRTGQEMWRIVAESGAGYVIMHVRGTPQTMHLEAKYDDTVSEVDRYFSERMSGVNGHGIEADRMILDPGLGFAKTAEHNFQLLGGLSRFKIHQRPVLLGASRKSFIGKLLGGKVDERLPGSLACAVWAVLNGVQIIRTHDVAATLQAVRMIEEIQAHMTER
ncbi:MAG TPA: dihydropteroate synthase [Verrucomicrobiae bacterium]|jgi:dihydropteroate synthase|nr:dihydropteroate synthase [Verrucomicrobiae bacterium]